MTDWTAGYVADVGYTFGYYAELNPSRMRLALQYAGYRAPNVTTACELGFGQGVSVNIHAATSTGTWHGTDFNPSQAGSARLMAEAAGSNVRLSDDSFADYSQRADLPDFDFIALHGIWSWISDANRGVIVDFLRRKLKVGGVLYISYNTQPGWAAFAPLQHLMTRHATLMSAKGPGTVPKVDAALKFAERLFATQPAYGLANPNVAERLRSLGQQSRRYLAHEYFNRDWQPMHFGELAERLEAAKLQFACSASPLDTLDAIHLTEEQQALMRDIPDTNLRESVRDFVVNQQFRRDLWIKGPIAISPLERQEALLSSRLVLLSDLGSVPRKINGALGEAALLDAVYRPLVELMADHRPRTLEEIAEGLRIHDIPLAQLFQAAMVLVATGTIYPVQDESAISAARLPTCRLNQHLMNRARCDGEISFLASPVTGGGVPVSRFQQLFLLARSQGHAIPVDWAAFAAGQLKRLDQRILKDGKTLESDEENLAELLAQAVDFAQKRLPGLIAVEVA